ncbi:MAG: FAD-dependent oxidoreductase [Candidatus Lokiarchaeia archaeon]|nr:FAD-dependent oxidoreductase [Candidatus Lokiarchaeia archaeon]
MINLKSDITIIGGGIAGLAAGISAKKTGAKKVIIIDRNDWIGGILPQCIHDGFGIKETKTSLTGPEYVHKYIQEAKKLDIDFFIKTMVLSFNNKLEVIAVSKKGLFKIKSRSIILAMGCREKTRGNLMIPGDRPSGIYTAGLAQTLINLNNIMPGKNILILGSGDVGLIMARRLKLEGANVLGVIEILSHPTGLPRNIVQCLKDYEIPLYLNYTITSIEGKNRLEKIIISKVDELGKIINGTELTFKCDTLLLSVGLIPENELSKEAGIKIDKLTNGPLVNQNYETTLSGIYTCGNCLQVYDTVELLSIHAKIAGKYSANYAIEKNIRKNRKIKIIVEPKNGIKYVIPQKINKSGIIEFSIKVIKPSDVIKIYFKINDREIHSKKIKYANPANIINLNVKIPEIPKNSKNILEVGLFEE